MLAQELRKGDVFVDKDGRVEITIDCDAIPDGINSENGKPQVYVDVRYRDGGRAPRWFDHGAEVPYTRPGMLKHARAAGAQED